MRVCPKRAGPDVWIPADISGLPGCQAAVPRGGTRHAPGTVPLAVTLAVCFDDARGRCNFSKNFRAASGSSFGVREIAIWSRIMIRVCETISRGLAVALPPGAGRPRVRVGVRP